MRKTASDDEARRTAVIGKVISTAAEVLALPAEQIGLASRFKEDLGASSLDMATLLMLLEDELHVCIPEQEARHLATVADTVEFVLQRETVSGEVF